MNTPAVFIGLFYGVLSAVVCYVVSMITGGLFARPFYRLYSRFLIAICSVMLLAPGLRWVAMSSDGKTATILLTLAQYLVVGILGYGVFRFNRDFMKRLFFKRHTAAYFIFGTLANATLVTLAFLHVAVTATPGWTESAAGLVSAANYGPFLVLLAAMVFHTDFHLKRARGESPRFGRFTFLGYAISFVGLALSIVPHLHDAITQLQITAASTPHLHNFFSAQALLIAILLYGWLVYRYESIPPLFLLLLAIIGEYHVLVTQWAIRAWGAECWGIASLPLFTGLVALDHYFSDWDRRKREVSGHIADEDAIRFATPFRWVGIGLAIALCAVTLWTRFYTTPGASPAWLFWTFVVYALFFQGLAVFRRTPALLYVGSFLGLMAALFGIEPLGSGASTLLIAFLSVGWAATAIAGQRRGMKLSWCTPLSDSALIAAIVTTVIVFSKHLLGEAPYEFQRVGPFDAAALVAAAGAFLGTAWLYRSRVPVFGCLIALATAVPPWNAWIGLAATAAGVILESRLRGERKTALDDRILMFGQVPLPMADVLPSLYTKPLAFGAIPLTLIGLVVSATHVLRGDLSTFVLSGTFTAAIALIILTWTYRTKWLYLTALATWYFSIHSLAQATIVPQLPSKDVLGAHLLVASGISLAGWIIASVYAWWCGAMLVRVAEAKEAGYRERRVYYAGLLYHVTGAATLGLLFAIGSTWLATPCNRWWLMAAATICTGILAWAASVYRSQIGSSLALVGLSLLLLIGIDAFGISPIDGAAVIAGLAAAAVSCFIPRKRPAENAPTIATTQWLTDSSLLQAQGTQLWIQPVCVYSIICTLAAIATTFRLPSTALGSIELASTAPLVYLAAAAALFLCTRTFRNVGIYVGSILMVFAAAHTALWQYGSMLGSSIAWTHLSLASVICLAFCLAAGALATLLNRRIPPPDREPSNWLRDLRGFYAGTTVHVALFASVVALIALALVVLLGDDSLATPTWWMIGGCSLLTASFTVLARLYQSRIPVYGALITGSIGCVGLAEILLSPAAWHRYEMVMIPLAGVALGAASWLIARWEVPQESLEPKRPRRPYDCWDSPPLPMVSLDASRWSIPLSHASVALALLALGRVGFAWIQQATASQPPWQWSLPIYLSSIALLIATKTHRTRWLRFATEDATAAPDRQLANADWAERGVLYVLSILTFGAATHATLQLVAMGGLPWTLAAGWHALLTSLLVVAGWLVATVYTPWRRSRVATPGHERSELQVEADVSLYSGLLHQVLLLVSILTLCGLGFLCLPPHPLSLPVAGATFVLVVYFALAGDTYRSSICNYLSLAALAMGTAEWAAITTASDTLVAPRAVSSLALLGLVLACLAVWLTRLLKTSDNHFRFPFRFPAPWEDSPLPVQSTCRGTAWRNPLTHASLVLSLVTVAAVVIRHGADLNFASGAADAALTGLAAFATLLLSARLYNSPGWTYVAATILAVTSVPVLSLLNRTDAQLGIVLGALAVGFWIAAVLAEWRSASRSAGQSFSDQERNGPTAAEQLIRLYANPFLRCSAFLSIIAIGHGLAVWNLEGWSAAQPTLFIASALGAINFLLNARTMCSLRQPNWAQTLVYLACTSFLIGYLAFNSIQWQDLIQLGPSTGVAALAMSVLGWMLVASGRSATPSEPQKITARLSFGQPFSRFAWVLSFTSITLSILSIVILIEGTASSSAAQIEWGVPDRAQLWTPAIALLLAGAVAAISVRVERRIGWLHTAVFLVSNGVILLLTSLTSWPLHTMTIAILLWMNALIFAGQLVKANRTRARKLLGLPDTHCERPFLAWPLVVVVVILSGEFGFLANAYLGSRFSLIRTPAVTELSNTWPWLRVNLLCGLALLQIFILHPRSAYLHLLVGSSIACLAGMGLSSVWGITPDVAIATLGLGWGLLAAIVHRPSAGKLSGWMRLPVSSGRRAAGERILRGWSIALIGTALAITLPVGMHSRPDYPNVSITLLLAILAALTIGLRWRDVRGIFVSAALLPLCLTATCVHYGYQQQLLGYGGLVSALIATIYLGVSRMLLSRGDGPGTDSFRVRVAQGLLVVADALGGAVAILAVWSVVAAQPTVSTALSLLLISLCWVYMAWQSGTERYVFSALVGFFVAAIYCGHSVLGIDLIGNSIAAFLVIVYVYLMYAVNVLCGRSGDEKLQAFVRPSYIVALALPATLLAAVPFEQRGPAAFILLAAASFYFTVSHRTHTRWTSYAAILLVNVAIYLWVPTARQITGLYQLYVIPAAITVLIFAHLHRRDLNPNVLSAIRLGATSLILAVSTFEVFVSRESSLLEFVVVLSLSLAGVVAGIALRIKPFVYTGLAFLILNVVGQLGLQFHRETGVTRAVILIAVGLLVLVAMIFFNVHRERILRQYRGFLMDDQWK
ncbi:hypothetical protein FYK55_14890 [Roseiconus nitratireducens]|uniref:Uncharacterized protein n=1 Tax=Roseiconus nitratireducens TaxID=2605748 RepID=A0A5M6D435_9BACT|nr:hypothetical protein [Roseiconus nitratireducens]KAA5542093.1 hypothetical protein FYK55_14890 [Roseiconus nitratireducens]